MARPNESSLLEFWILQVHVMSEIKVDPIFLSIIEQENKVELEIGSPI